jgi:hypothetical protein
MDTTRDTNRSSEDHHERPVPRSNRTYYQHGGVRVTDHWLTVADRRYAIADLTALRTVRGPRDPFVVGATVVAAMAVIVGVVGWRYSETPVVWAGILVGSIVPAGLAALTGRVRHRHYELWAQYRGADVRLLVTPDERVYGAITRALIRAREAAGPPDDLIGHYGLPAPA